MSNRSNPSTQTKLKGSLPVTSSAAGPHIICIEQEMPRLAAESRADLVNESSPESIAYVSFTQARQAVRKECVFRIARWSGSSGISTTCRSVRAMSFCNWRPLLLTPQLSKFGLSAQRSAAGHLSSELPVLRELAETIERERITRFG